ncbi:MAG: hypothetical protein ACRECO_10040 [Xanthobacteraceae bacterium]
MSAIGVFVGYRGIPDEICSVCVFLGLTRRTLALLDFIVGPHLDRVAAAFVRQEGTVKLSGASYLYTLAQLSIGIVGFSGIIIVLLQSLGGELTAVQRLRTRILIEAGFTAAAGSMVPPLIALSYLSSEVVWQISSLIAGPLLLVWAVMYPIRRRAVAHGPTPPDVLIGVTGRIITAIGVLVNGIGYPFVPGPFLYCLAMTWVLGTACQILIRAVTQSLPSKTS